MFEFLRLGVKLKGYRVYHFPDGKPSYTAVYGNTVTFPNQSIKRFLKELEGEYWLNIEHTREITQKVLPIHGTINGNDNYWAMDFSSLEFSILVNMYRELSDFELNMVNRANVTNALVYSMCVMIKHASKRTREKVLEVLHDPLFDNFQLIPRYAMARQNMEMLCKEDF